LSPRDPHEEHRVSTPLELLTDLCFVVAVAQASAGLHHAIAGDHISHGLIGFGIAFFAIWWTWLNFSWFASAYDNDDVVYRLLTILQIIGVLVLAAGVPGFFSGDFLLPVTGYVIMRIALVIQWLRASRGDTRTRRTCHRYALGLVVVQLLWVGLLAVPHAYQLFLFPLLALLDLGVPVWAERTGETPWHPEHIAERYALFFIIVLGESILAVSLAIQAAWTDLAHAFGALVVLVGGVLIVFGMWWLYFARDASVVLERARSEGTKFEYVWGFGHYFIFASGAAVGAGLALRAEYWTHPEEIPRLASAAAVTVPIAVLMAALYLIQLRQHDPSRRAGLPFLIAIALVLVCTFSALPELLAGLVLAALLVTELRQVARTSAGVA
jgi:low temperature requirement protein LtrA